MKSITIAILFTITTLCVSEYTTFYNQPEYRYYYGYHPYDRSYRSLKDLIKRQDQVVNDEFSLVFNRDDVNIVNCTFNSTSKFLQCSGPFSDLNCTSSLDFAHLENVYFETYGLGKLVLSEDGLSTGFVKYQVNPFEVDSRNETIIVYEYSIPIYGYGLSIFVNVTGNLAAANSSPNMLTQGEYVCFNALIGLLNESKFFYNMKTVSNIINKAFEDLIL